MRLKRHDQRPDKKPSTLFDRIAIGSFSGVCALGLGSFIWFMLSWKLMRLASLPFLPVVYGSIVVAVLGFLLAENVVIAAIALLLDLLFSLARFW